MKKVFPYIVIVVVTTLVVYGAVAFYEFSFSLSDLPKGKRGSMMIMWACIVIFVSFIYKQESK